MGDGVAVRAVSLAPVATLGFGAAATVLAMIGGALIAASVAAAGHALEGPRALSGALLTAHPLSVAYWIAALVPLRRLARGGSGAGLVAPAFGRNAAWAVGGPALLSVMAGDPIAALAIKLDFVAALPGFAARSALPPPRGEAAPPGGEGRPRPRSGSRGAGARSEGARFSARSSVGCSVLRRGRHGLGDAPACQQRGVDAELFDHGRRRLEGIEAAARGEPAKVARARASY